MTERPQYGILGDVNEHTRPTLTIERRDAIAELVAQQGTARVSELAERFDVSPATIRRDLETLEEFLPRHSRFKWRVSRAIKETL